MWVYVVCMQSQANEATPDKIQSKGKSLPVERSLSEEQCEYENATCTIHLVLFASHIWYGDVTNHQMTKPLHLDGSLLKN